MTKDLITGVKAQDSLPLTEGFSVSTCKRTRAFSSESSDGLPEVVGEFKVSIKKGPDGELETVHEEKNLIVNAAKTYLLTGIYLPNIISDPIISLTAGSGGAIDPLGLYPKPEDPLQTALITPEIVIPTIYVLSVTDIAVQFLADIDQSQANGILFTEAGLLKASGSLFNIKNHPGIPKTSEFSIHYSWNIRFL